MSGGMLAAQIQTIRRVMPLAEALARVDALTMADVKATAGKVINDKNHEACGNRGGSRAPRLQLIRRHSYMLRY